MIESLLVKENKLRLCSLSLQGTYDSSRPARLGAFRGYEHYILFAFQYDFIQT